jgi:hypothetical protein
VSGHDDLHRTAVRPVRCSGPLTDQLWLAVAAYLGRFLGSSRYHAESDLRCYLAWCPQRGLDALAAHRAQLELYIRRMHEVRRFKPSTVSRWFSVAAGFYRTAVIDGLLEHSPAEHVRRPAVPAEPPTLGFTHLQFEALLTAARESPNPCDFALVARLALLGLRIFAPARTPTTTPTSWPPTWPPAPDRLAGPAVQPQEAHSIAISVPGKGSGGLHAPLSRPGCSPYWDRSWRGSRGCSPGVPPLTDSVCRLTRIHSPC